MINYHSLVQFEEELAVLTKFAALYLDLRTFSHLLEMIPPAQKFRDKMHFPSVLECREGHNTKITPAGANRVGGERGAQRVSFVAFLTMKVSVALRQKV